MAEQQNDPTPPPSDTGNVESVREGEDAMGERAGEGGYGNDTGFATGTRAPRDDAGSVEGGTSAREQQTSDTYREAGQGQDSPGTAGGTH